MSKDLAKHNLAVILIQIDEAHSSAWPIALEDQPEPHASIENRMQRAKLFVSKYGNTYPVYVDLWNNVFAETFRAWPDKYHCVDNNLQVIGKATYGTEGKMEAIVEKDYTVLLKELMNK